ncbi:MAG: nucleotide exchange factor GrpE [Patescibacteria group bacterium]
MDNENLEELKEELAKCEKQRDEYLDGWKRAKADFINYKKEEMERFSVLTKFGNEVLVLELLNVLDSFDLSLAILKDDEATQKGIFLIRNQLEDLLKKHGLEKIAVASGDNFDPVRHEAVAEIESDKPAGIIHEEVKKGYTLNGKVLRPARVKISKGQI